MLYLILLIVLIFALLPQWPYARGWNAGYYPSGIGFVLLVILIVLLATGRI